MISFRFSDLTGTDYSEAAIELARNLAIRDGFTNINFLVWLLNSLLCCSALIFLYFAYHYGCKMLQYLYQ